MRQFVLGSFDRFRDLARARVAILSINATPQLLPVLSLAFQFCCGLCSLNPLFYYIKLRLRCAIIALAPLR